MDSVLAPRLLTGSEEKIEKKKKRKQKEKRKKQKQKQRRKLGDEARRITGSQTEEHLECQSEHL